jgi:uncharacterized radical SAM superfamily Fe-S cluster-containing enzyme
MEVDKLLQQLEMLNDTYLWSIDEAHAIVQQIDALMESDNLKKFHKIEKLRDKFMELQQRHVADRRLYDTLIAKSRDYFMDKYNIDLLKILHGEDI